MRIKAKLAVDLRDEFEQWIQGGMYSRFLDKFVPILLKLLDTPISFMSNSHEQVEPLCSNHPISH